MYNSDSASDLAGTGSAPKENVDYLLNEVQEMITGIRDSQARLQNMLMMWMEELDRRTDNLQTIITSRREASMQRELDTLKNLHAKALDEFTDLRAQLQKMCEEMEAIQKTTNVESPPGGERARREAVMVHDGDSTGQGPSGEARPPPRPTDPYARYLALFKKKRNPGDTVRWCFTWPYPGIMHATRGDRVEEFNVIDLV